METAVASWEKAKARRRRMLDALDKDRRELQGVFAITGATPGTEQRALPPAKDANAKD